MTQAFCLRRLGLVSYQETWAAMQRFNAARTAQTGDELWLCTHPPLLTLGLAGRTEHVLHDSGLPVVRTDRGGQVTYHGPGQLILYLLLDLRRLGFGVKQLVAGIEAALIATLAEWNIPGARLAGAPGVYVDGAKIAALGLRIRNGCCYHGLALNVACDLAPFAAINPCGMAGLPVTSMALLCPQIAAALHAESPEFPGIAPRLVTHLSDTLGLHDGTDLH